jgi:hypothetical protein
MRMWLALAAGVAAAAAGPAVWLLWPPPAAAPAQARQYLNVTACLLTGPGGIVPGSPGGPAWSAMQTASDATHVRVSYLPDSGPADAGAMLNTLVARQCGVIITTGTPPGPVIKAARANPHQRFVVIGARSTAAAVAPDNAVMVSPGNVAGSIAQAIHALAAHA